MNEVYLLELSEFEIKTNKERELFFLRANQSRFFANISIFDSNKKIKHESFASYIFVEKENNFKVEFLTDYFNKKIFENSIIVGSFKLDGVQFVFESEILDFSKEMNCVTITIGTPKKMIRLQRRNAFRVNIPLKYDVKIDLNNKDDNLKNLRITNISLTGATIIVSADEKIIEENNEFKNAIIYFNNNIKFNLDLKIKRKRSIKIPLKNKKEYFEIGVKFENIPHKMEQEIFLLINEITRNFKS